jgi:4-hydroxymandelate oxidase
MIEFSTIDRLFELAVERIPSPRREFILSVAGNGGTHRRNRAAIENLVINQRLVQDAEPVDTSVDWFGTPLASPIILGPIGVSASLWSDGDREMVRGAARAASMATVSANATATFAQLGDDARDAGPGPLLFQLHHDTDPVAQQDMLQQVSAHSAYIGACVTVHSTLSPRLDAQIEANAATTGGKLLAARPVDRRFSWTDMERLRSYATIPFGVKGIMDARDAVEAVDRGADFVWVGNHGARLLDSAPASIDALDDIASAIDGRVPIIVDSGFERGSDVLKAIARGATLVAFGKLAACALFLNGSDGVEQLVRILRAELENALVFSGHSALRDVTSNLLRRV